MSQKKPDSSKTKKKLASLALAFALVAPPLASATESDAPPKLPDASASVDAPKKPFNLRGLWKNYQYDIVGEVKDCPDKPGALCSSIYWLADTSDAKYAASVLTAPRGYQPEDGYSSYHNTPVSAYCGQPLSSNLQTKDGATWTGTLDPNPAFQRSVDVEVTQLSENFLQGKVEVRFLFFPKIKRESTAWRVSPDDKRFPPCSPS